MTKRDWSWKPPKETAREKPGERRKKQKMRAQAAIQRAGLQPASQLERVAEQLMEVGAVSRTEIKSKSQARAIIRRWAKRTARTSADPFYLSWEWKKARFEVLKRYGAKCMCCGSEESIVVDHILPRSRHPELSLDLDNLQVLCDDCNRGKSNDDVTDFRPDGPREVH